MSMPPIAAMICGRAERGSGGGRPSRAATPPGRGEVSAKSRSHTSTCASGFMPRATFPRRSTQAHTSLIGPLLIWPNPEMPPEVVTSTSTMLASFSGSCAVHKACLSDTAMG